MSLPLHAAAIVLMTVAGLSGCQASEPGNAQDATSSAELTGLDGVAEMAIGELRDELATEDLALDDDEGKLPKAALSPRGELLIDGKPVALDARQQAIALDYRTELAGIALAGAEVGLEGAALAKVAMKEAAKALFGGDKEAMEARIEAEAEGVKTAALALCGRLPALLASQTRFADAVPEFVPYARMSQKDIEECEVDL
ncbi:MAG: hypothetical protein KA196_00925 [Arenimonas sp.]|nr:hypothetical protein [Arenimonas sp.]